MARSYDQYEDLHEDRDREVYSGLPSLFKLWLVGLLVGFGFFFLVGGSPLQSFSEYLSGGPPRLKSVAIDLNGRRIRLMADQALVIRPLDHIRLLEIESNLFSDADLTLEGQGFEARPILTGTKVDDLLPSTLKPIAYNLTVKKGHQIMGKVALIPVALPMDWVLMSHQAVGTERLALLNKAATLAPDSPPLLDLIFQSARRQDQDKIATAALSQRMVRVTSPADMAALAEYYEKIGQAKKQAKLLAVLAKLEPEKELWANRLLNLAERSKDQSVKLSALKNLVEGGTGSTSTKASKKLGYALVKAGKLKEAAKAYEEAAKLDPEDVNIFRNLAAIYSELDDPEKQLGALISAARLKPDEVELHLAIAALYGRLNRPQKQLAAFKQVIRLKPDDLNARKTLARSAKGPVQIQAWEEVLKIDPQDEEATVRLIKLYQAAERHDRLVVLYKKLARQKPKDWVIPYNLGMTQIELKRYAEAEQSFHRALKLAPKNIDILTRILEVQQSQKKVKGALETAERILALKPTEMELYRYVYSGLSRFKAHDRLERVLTRGVKANPDSAELWKLMALTRLKQKDAKGASQALAKAVEIDPDNLDNRIRLAKLYDKIGQTEKASAQYRAAIKRKPREIAHRLALAQLLERTGQLKAASVQYAAILEIDPDHEAAGSAHVRLRLKLLKQKKKKSN